MMVTGLDLNLSKTRKTSSGRGGARVHEARSRAAASVTRRCGAFGAVVVIGVGDKGGADFLEAVVRLVVALGVCWRYPTKEVVGVSTEEERCKQCGEVVGCVLGSVHLLELDKITLNPFAERK